MTTESTIDRDTLLLLMDQWGQPGSAALVDQVLGEIGMGDKQAFTKADFITVMQGVTRHAQAALERPEAAPGASDAERAHMREMLAAIDAHALPLLRDEAR